ncbi:ankyrin repeat-containing domain protein [Globomyces pollinis-pini]|nr:ankyrin repeat-containing domain protein [Globomyces pollinis-pini]
MVALTDNDNIWIAASDGRISDVQRYLQTQSANTQDENGYSPLAAASSYGHHSLIELLIKEYQADINIIDQEGDTPLHVALDLKTVQLLMELGANPHLRNNESHLVSYLWV